MIWLLAAALLSSTLIGYLASRVFLPDCKPRWADLTLKLSLGAGLGAGLTSCLYFLVRLVLGPSTGIFVAAELLLAVAAGSAAWLARHGRVTAGSGDAKPAGWFWLLLAGLLGALAIAVPSFVDTSNSNPFGGWDAWAIWNLRAKLLAQPDATWKSAFTPVLNQLAGGGATHPEYPLLLSGFVARCWDLMGAIGNVAAPTAISAMFSLATVGLMVSALAILRSWSAAMIGGLILVGATAFQLESPWQFADIPIGFYYLAVFALLFLNDAEDQERGRTMVLAGLALGFAAWTKREGMLFALLTVVAVVCCAWVSGKATRRRTLLLFALGAAVPLAIVMYYRLFLAPPTGDFATLTLAAAARKFTDLPRYAQIFKSLWDEIIALGSGIAHPLVSIAVLAFCLGIPRERRTQPLMMASFAVWLAVFIGYVVAYVVTPQELAWHLGTSLGRLLVQLLPGLIFLSLALLRTVEETAITIRRPEKAARAGGKKARKMRVG